MTGRRKLPVSTAKMVAQKHGLRQVLLIGYDGEQVHVVTYGKTKADCAQAATAQDFWTGKIKEFSFSAPAKPPSTTHDWDTMGEIGPDDHGPGSDF